MLGRIALLLLFAVPACTPAFAEDFTSVEVVKVYDGDTITVNLPGLPAVFGHHLSVRLRGIDAPELKGQCANEKTQALVARGAMKAMLQRAAFIELRNVSRDKYFRIDATIFVDGRDLNAYMVAQGFARPYDGGARQGWCAK